MSEILRVLDEDRRLVILRTLDDQAERSANESILQSCLHLYGHMCSRDQVRTLLDWLAEQGLVTLREVSGYKVAKLTRRGLEVATGHARVSGVKRPGPTEED